MKISGKAMLGPVHCSVVQKTLGRLRSEWEGYQKHRQTRPISRLSVPPGGTACDRLLLSALGYPEKVRSQFLSLRQFKPKEIHWLLELALWRRTSRVRHLSPRAVEYPTLGF